MNKRLLVIITDRLTDLIKKGEITSRYYNPSELFEEVHILMVNDDRPNPDQVRKTVGSAKLYLHNLPGMSKGMFLKSLGWQPFLLKNWAKSGVKLAEQISPDLIRCHGNRINAFVASEIKRHLGIPYVISLHINPDSDMRYHASWRTDWTEKIALSCTRRLEAVNIKSSDCVICVYKFIIPYAAKYKANRIELIYNAVNPDNLKPKETYAVSGPAKLISIGRQFAQKDPTPLIHAVKKIPGVELTLIGDGPIREGLQSLAKDLNISNRCFFNTRVNNDQLCRNLKNYDVLISINQYGGVSKVELEAAHVGMPVITNEHPMEDSPEILEENCIVVDGSVESYSNAIMQLINDERLRQKLGSDLRMSVRHITPNKMERKVTELYKEIITQVSYPQNKG